MSNYKTTQKAQAKYLYFTTAHTQKVIAHILGINEKTMSQWVRGGNWAALKKAAYHSPEQEVEQLYKELRQINENINKRPIAERFGTKEELEARAKILAIITGPLKNHTDAWRNIAPELDYEPLEMASSGDGKFSHDTLRDYYTRVASLLVSVDMGAARYKESLTVDNPASIVNK